MNARPPTDRLVLYVVVCAAPPARQIGQLIRLLINDGWTVCVITTPSAASWIDRNALAEQTGYPVRSDYKRPDDPDILPKADAIALVPATFNTINKWATGISDNLALGILNEALGLGLPILVSPYAKPTLTRHPAYPGHVHLLAAAGVTFTPAEAIRPQDENEPFLWHLIRDAVAQLKPNTPI